MTTVTSIQIPARDLQAGDSIIGLSGQTHRVTKIEPYDHSSVNRGSEALFAQAFGVVHVEGHGAYTTLWDNTWIEVAA